MKARESDTPRLDPPALPRCGEPASQQLMRDLISPEYPQEQFSPPHTTRMLLIVSI